VSKLCQNAELTGVENCEILRNGGDRSLPNEDNKAYFACGESACYKLNEPFETQTIKIVFDSDLKRTTFNVSECEKHHSMRCNIQENSPVMHLPKTLVKSYLVEITLANGEKKIFEEKENKKRNVLLEIRDEIVEAKLTVFENWGGLEKSGVFTFELIG
jgi:hypothetical protein